MRNRANGRRAVRWLFWVPAIFTGFCVMTLAHRLTGWPAPGVAIVAALAVHLMTRAGQQILARTR